MVAFWTLWRPLESGRLKELNVDILSTSTSPTAWPSYIMNSLTEIRVLAPDTYRTQKVRVYWLTQGPVFLWFWDLILGWPLARLHPDCPDCGSRPGLQRGLNNDLFDQRAWQTANLRLGCHGMPPIAYSVAVMNLERRVVLVFVWADWWRQLSPACPADQFSQFSHFVHAFLSWLMHPLPWLRRYH